MSNVKIKTELEELAAQHEGRVTPDLVVAAAREKGTAIHEYFKSRDCFDPKKSQHHWQLAVARELIRSVKVTITTETFSIKAPIFVRDPEAGQAQGYATLSRLRSDEDVARDAVVSEFGRAGAALARAQAIAVALNLANEIGEIRERVKAFASRVEAAGSATAQ